MEKKYIVIDTNIYLLDPVKALHSFGPRREGIENHVIIPAVVTDEIEKFKREEYSTRGMNAREFGNHLKKLMKEYEGDVMRDGLKIADRHYIHLEEKPERDLEKWLGKITRDVWEDDYILALACKLKKENEKSNTKVELVTNDTMFGIRAVRYGLKVSDWEDLRFANSLEDIYTGWRFVETDQATIDTILTASNGKQTDFDLNKLGLNVESALLPNEYLILIQKGYEVPKFEKLEPNQKTEFALARHVITPELPEGGLRYIRPRISNANDHITGIYARNFAQAFALDALMDSGISLVNLIGPAGTGKTLISLAAGFKQINTGGHKQQRAGLRRYNMITITRPVVVMGNDIGYLPGDEEEKMAPWMMPIWDNIEHLRGGIVANLVGKTSVRNKVNKDEINMANLLKENKWLDVQPLHSIRGRSLSGAYLIIDEGQNTTPLEIKTLITRAGEGTKVVVTGDPRQIDAKGLNEVNNGLCYASERMKKEQLTATVFLGEGERSDLATIASRKL